MIRLRHQQPTAWEGLFAEEVAELWEPWMRIADELLEDEACGCTRPNATDIRRVEPETRAQLEL